MLRLLLTAMALAGLLAAGAAPLAMGQGQSQAHVRSGAPHGAGVDSAPEDDDASTPGVQITPTAGAARTVNIRVDVEDPNGHNDINSVKVTLFKPDNSTVHVAEGAASKLSGAGTRANFSRGLTINYWDTPGVYHVKAAATDRDGGSTTGWSTFEIVALTALSLDLGSVSLNPGGGEGGAIEPGGNTDDDPASVTIENAGNVAIDLQYSGTDLADPDSGATIPVANVTLSSSSDMAGKRALAANAATDEAFNLPKGQGSSKTLYFSVSVPEGVPAGTYTGAITLAAVQG